MSRKDEKMNRPWPKHSLQVPTVGRLPRTPEQFWLEHVRICFPEYRSRTYFFPSIHVSLVSYSVAVIADQQVLVPQEPQEEADRMLSPAERKRSRRRRSLAESSSTNISSAKWPRHQGTFGGQKAVLGKDARDDRALRSLLMWLHGLVKSSETHKGMIVVSQLEFGKYLHKPTYAAAADRLPRPSSINIENYRQGDFDLLIIHSEFGLITFEIKSVGANFRELKMTEQNEDDIVLKKARQAIKQLNKAEAVLKHLVSDLQNVCVTKILVMPNVQFSQFVRVICNSSQDLQDLCKCLSAKSIDDAMKLCLLSDQLSDRTDMCDTALPAIRNLNAWWRQIFDASGTQPNLAPNVYEILVARFCGPGTTVEVHCDIPTQNGMRTEGEGVFVAGEIMNRIVLFPEQVNLLNTSPLNVFLTGPPGTGKTVVLILQGMIWMQRGHSVHVVSTCSASRAVAITIERQLQKSSKVSSESPSVWRHQFDLNKEIEHDETPAALLKSLSKDRLLCIIADEAGPDREHFTKFCDELLQHVPGVCLWAASVHHGVRPLCLEEIKMTFPLRSPPYVVDEVKKSVEIKNGHVLNYSPSEAHTPTDGPVVETITHLYDTSGHRGDSPHDCLQCGSEVAAILKRLGISSAGIGHNHFVLQYRDVLILCDVDPTDDQLDSSGHVVSKAMGLVQGLRMCHVPVRVVARDDEAAILGTAIGLDNQVTVTHWQDVLGLERKVVVVVKFNTYKDAFSRLQTMSRCSSKLVVVDW